MQIIQREFQTVATHGEVGLGVNLLGLAGVEMTSAVDGDVRRAVQLQLVGVQRAGAGDSDVGFVVRNVEGAAISNHGAGKGVKARQVGYSTPGNKLSACSADGTADDDAAFCRGNIRQLVRTASGIAVGVVGISRSCLALQGVLDGKEIVAFVGFSD